MEAVRRHLTEGPIDGVYELDNETADRVIDDGTQAALDAEIALIDQERGTLSRATGKRSPPPEARLLGPVKSIRFGRRVSHMPPIA
ncbi:hypothetical protein I552_0580 [Mycobacterium xenopi 3993]|nr:hypothetical protein I552_0580 [Mycobacterium xenopi 3993]